jgi:hypothetical protein
MLRMRNDLTGRLAPYQARQIPAVDLTWPPEAAPPDESPSLKSLLSWYRVTRLPRGRLFDHVNLPLAH